MTTHEQTISHSTDLPADPVALAGRAWATTVRSALHSEGRPAAGGWPGTMSEARSLVAQTVEPGLSLSTEERERRVRVLYNAAKEHWLSLREPAAG